MKDLRKAIWLAGCGFVGLLCVSCGTAKQNPPSATEAGLEDQRNKGLGKGVIALAAI